MDRYNTERHGALDVALLTSTSLQNAISAAKHASGPGHRRAPLSVRDLLYGRLEPTKTVAVHEDSSEPVVASMWYSMCAVLFRDIVKSIARLDNKVELELSMDKLDLYSLDTDEVVTAIDTMLSGCREPSCKYVSSTTRERSLSVLVTAIPHDIMTTVVRGAQLSCAAGDWSISRDGSTVYSIFKGDLFGQLVGTCSAVLSSNAQTMVKFLGKVNSMILYRRYIQHKNVDVYLSVIFCTLPNEVADYYSAAKLDPVKRITLRRQVESLLSSARNGRVDDLSSFESLLMVGATMED